MPQLEQASASTTPQSAETPSAASSRPRSSESLLPVSANQRASPRLPVTTNRSSASNTRTSRPPSTSSVTLPKANASGVRQSITSAGSSSSRPSSVKGPSLQPATSPKQASRGTDVTSQQRPTSGKVANAVESARRRPSSPATSAEKRRLSSVFESLQRGSNQTQHALSHQKALTMTTSPRMQSPRTSTSPHPTSLTASHHPPSDTNTSASHSNALNTIKERSRVRSSDSAASKGSGLPATSRNPIVSRQRQRRSSVPQVFTAKRTLGARKRRTPLFRRSHSPAPRSSIVPPPSGSQAAALPSASEGAIITSVPAPPVPMSPPLAAPVQIQPMTYSRVPIQVPTGRYVALPPRTTYIVPTSMATPSWPTSGASTTASSSITTGEESSRFPRLVVYSSEAASPQPLEIIEWHVSESDLVVTCTPASPPTEQSVQAPQDPPVQQGGGTTREVATQDETSLRNVSAQARITVLTNDVATNPPSAHIRHVQAPNTQAREPEEECQTDVTWVQPLYTTEERVKTPSATTEDVVSHYGTASGHDGNSVIPNTLQPLRTSSNSNQETTNERITHCDPQPVAQLEECEVNRGESASSPLRRKFSTTEDKNESSKENKISIKEHKTPSNVITQNATNMKSDQRQMYKTNLNNKTSENDNIIKIHTMDYIIEKVVDNVTSNTNNSIIPGILEEITNKINSNDNNNTDKKNPLEKTWSSEIQRKEDEISTTIIQNKPNQVITESEGNVSQKSVFSTPTLQTDNTRTGPTFFGPAGAAWYLSRWDTSAGETKVIHNGKDDPLNEVKINNQEVPQETSGKVQYFEKTAKEKNKFPTQRISSNAISTEDNFITKKMEADKSTKNISDESRGNEFILKHTAKEEHDTLLVKNSISPKSLSEYSRKDSLITTRSSIRDSKSKIPRMKTVPVPFIKPVPLQMDENNSEQVPLKNIVNSIPSPEKINISEVQKKESFRQISPLSIPDNTYKDLQHSEDESSYMTKVELYSPKTLNQQCSNTAPLKSEKEETQYFKRESTSTWDQLFANPSITSRVVPTTSLSISKQLEDNHEESTDIPPLSYSLIINEEQSSTANPFVLLTPPTPKDSTVGTNNDIRPLLDANRPATAPIIHDASTSIQSFVHKMIDISDQVAKSNKNDDAKLITKTSTSPKAQRSSSKEYASTFPDIHTDLKTNETSKPGTALWSAPSQELGTISPHMVESSTTDSEFERMRIEEIEKTLRFRLPTTSLATTIAKSEDSSSLVVKNSSKRTVAFAQSNSKTETLQRRVEPDSFDLGLFSGSSHMHFAIVPNTFLNSRPTESNNIPQKESPTLKQGDIEQDGVSYPITTSAQLKTLTPGSSLIRYLPSENSNSVRRINSNSPRIGGNLIKSILRLNSPEKNKVTVSQNSFNIVGSPQIRDEQLNDQETLFKSTKGQSPDAQDDYAKTIIKVALTKPRVAHFSEDMLSTTGVKKDLGHFTENNQSMQQMLQNSFQEVLSDYSDLSSSMSIDAESKEQSHDDLSREEALPSIHEESDLYTMGIKCVSSQSESRAGMTFNTSITVNSDEIKHRGMNSGTSNAEISLVEETHSKTSPKFRLGRKRTSRRRTTSNSPKQKVNTGDSSPEKSPKAKRNLIHRVSDIFAKPFRRTKSNSSRSPSRNAKESPRKNVGRLSAR